MRPQRLAAVLSLLLAFGAASTPSFARPKSSSKKRAAKAYVAPTRTPAQIAHAIAASNGNIPAGQRLALAKLLIRVAKEHNFDPLSGWAIIDHESDWRASAVGPDGEDIGLAQIRYTMSEVCRDDRESDACLRRRTALMDPETNIRAMTGAITAWRKLCHEKTGRAPNMQNWLAGYGGYSRPDDDVFCGRKRVKTKNGWHWKELPVPKAVADIISARKAMIARLRKDGIR